MSIVREFQCSILHIKLKLAVVQREEFSFSRNTSRTKLIWKPRARESRIVNTGTDEQSTDLAHECIVSELGYPAEDLFATRINLKCFKFRDAFALMLSFLPGNGFISRTLFLMHFYVPPPYRVTIAMPVANQCFTSLSCHSFNGVSLVTEYIRIQCSN